MFRLTIVEKEGRLARDFVCCLNSGSERALGEFHNERGGHGSTGVILLRNAVEDLE